MFTLRVDLESKKGISKGLPTLLDLLRDYDIKASFYLTMGGEPNIFDLLRYRKKLRGERKIKIFTKKEMLRIIFFPEDFVRSNREILKRILKGGHELGIHGWKHRAWGRGLLKRRTSLFYNNINAKSIDSGIKRLEEWIKSFAMLYNCFIGLT